MHGDRQMNYCAHTHPQNLYIYANVISNKYLLTPYMYVCMHACIRGKLQVSFAKEPDKRDDILQKRPVILRSLLIVATPYMQTCK